MLVLMKHSDEKLGSRHFLVAHGVLQDARRCVGAEPSQLRVALPRRAVPDQARQGGRAARTPARPPRRRRLHQPGPAGEPRSAAEAELCTRAAEELYGLYLHPATWIIEMTSLPEDYPAAFTFAAASPFGSPNPAPFGMRGWTLGSVASRCRDKHARALAMIGRGWARAAPMHEGNIIPLQ